ncbi:hypothetical protein GWO43_01170, partial [candidate division KSB1 bacterium]|nr:hypothetical protein [candidate division KSB1 bacterium]NIT69531.1 hypothetical protein [candidate division KSB1 bacterium]NIU23186.1 hypothetical protein [candidate division KSB1 bacterium]NIU90258.1 hypothetical protein [candidate division KSB1 bacterium]NIW17041.1 hypothetical protein [candidate division KSB1 bacterium]
AVIIIDVKLLRYCTIDLAEMVREFGLPGYIRFDVFFELAAADAFTAQVAI